METRTGEKVSWMLVPYIWEQAVKVFWERYGPVVPREGFTISWPVYPPDGRVPRVVVVISLEGEQNKRQYELMLAPITNVDWRVLCCNSQP